MAGKIKSMSQIKQLLQFHSQGKGKKYIARTLHMSRNTVKAYLEKFKLLELNLDDVLKLEDPELEAIFHAGNPAYKNERFDQLKSKFPYLKKELKRVGVTRHLLWEEYKTECPDGYSFSQFCHHLSQFLKAQKPSAILDHKPGEQMFVDFAGKKLSYVDPDTGLVIQCNVLVACFPFSDYAFAIAVRDQSIEDFIYALKECLNFFGGCPQVLVPDNLKAAVIKANRYEPTINKALEDFSNHYNMAVVPTRVRKPKDKALVENQVRLIYSRVYAKIRNQTFFSLTELNKSIRKYTILHNQTRMQIMPYCREECFLAKERELLHPLPSEEFELKYYRTLTVAKNNHIQLTQDKHYYSVPYQYIGQKAKVIYTRTTVRIFISGELVAVHRRNRSIGTYSTIKDHLCSTHRHYLDRSPKYYEKMAHRYCPELAQLVNCMFGSDRHPEQLYRSCDGLFSLARKAPQEDFRKACMMAIQYEKYTYQFLKNSLENKTYMMSEVKVSTPLPRHTNIRKDFS